MSQAHPEPSMPGPGSADVGQVAGTDIACGQELEVLYQAQLAPPAPEPAARIGWDFGIPRLPSAGLRRHVLGAADDCHQAAGPFTRFASIRTAPR
jgi:hypothetical protein